MFSDLLEREGRLFSRLEVNHRNHFDLALDLGDRTTVLDQAVSALVDSTNGV
ncbi:hypothetical protein ACAX43_28885 [Paraburkholderia sp. IW21]|uniref:hypothetical protein n=1 Tax=Paraburkholderia sp. IW21 TaxID=3242488 RepID=UPI0035203B7B